MKPFNEIRIVDGQSLMTESASSSHEIRLADGTIVLFEFDGNGRLIGGTMRRPGQQPTPGFVMTLSSASSRHSITPDLPGQKYTCYFCGNDEQVGVCFCYQIDCGPLGLR